MRGLSSLGAMATVAVLFVGASCGGDDESVSLSEAGERGRQVANSNGCVACHGANGEGGAGPSWQGLAGSIVELEFGEVVADDDYLRRSIADPDADVRAGYTLKMPPNSLSDDETADVIAYIHDLGPRAGEFELSAAGARGKDLVDSNGCNACHGSNGAGGPGGALQGLAGTTIELADESLVVADDAYLARAITDPGAERPAGSSLKMPGSDFTDEEVDDIVAYIWDLNPSAVSSDE